MQSRSTPRRAARCCHSPCARHRPPVLRAPRPRRCSAVRAPATASFLAPPPLAPAPPFSPADAQSLRVLFTSAAFAAGLLALGSLLLPSGRKRWASLLAGWRDALPANASLRRAIAWLPVIAAAKTCEALTGLPLLNWVYIASSASIILQGIAESARANAPAAAAAAAARAASSSSAPAAAAAPPQPAFAPGPGGINALAAGLFSNRFPELAGEALVSTSPAMLDVVPGTPAPPSAKPSQGQLYVTARHVAFHGAFGRSKWVARLDCLVDARASPAPSPSLIRTTLVTEDGEAVAVTAVRAMGGEACAGALGAAWTAARAALASPPHVTVDAEWTPSPAADVAA